MENGLTNGVREVDISESVDVTVYFHAIGIPSSSSTDSLVPGSNVEAVLLFDTNLAVSITLILEFPESHKNKRFINMQSPDGS